MEQRRMLRQRHNNIIQFAVFHVKYFAVFYDGEGGEAFYCMRQGESVSCVGIIDKNNYVYRGFGVRDERISANERLLLDAHFIHASHALFSIHS